MTGPRAAEPGYDYVLQGIAGWMSLTGDPDGPPTTTGLSLVDFSSGFVAALNLLAGLYSARRDGVGGDCDVSLSDTAMSLLTHPATWALNAGFEPVRTVDSAHPSLVPFQAFAHPVDHWLGLLAAAGVPSAPINDVNQALADPQATARGLLAETEHPHWGTVRQVGLPVRFGEQPVEHRRAPHRNEHQHDITPGLLGYPAERTAALEAAGAVGRQES